MMLSALIIATALSTAPADPRVCGVTARDADGRIARSAAEVRRFRALWPCPSTRKTVGACPGWAVDHVIPLSVGGCDAVGNMQWLPWATKAASSPDAKDRWEREVYRRSP